MKKKYEENVTEKGESESKRRKQGKGKITIPEEKKVKERQNNEEAIQRKEEEEENVKLDR